MHDIFISYAREDKETAKLYALALEALSFTVWWDRDIPAGQQFDEVIETALNNTKCLVVLWTSKSISSKWVKSETAEAEERGILVPVLVEEVKIPLAFRRIQAVNMIGWDGDTTSELFKDLVDNITRIVKPSINKANAKYETAQEHTKVQPARTGLSALTRLRSLASNRAAQITVVTLFLIVIGTNSLVLDRVIQDPLDDVLSQGPTEDVHIINEALKNEGFDSIDKLEEVKRSETKISKNLRYLKRKFGEPDQDDPDGVKKLDFRKKKITDAGLERLKILSNLRTLNLDSTNITDAGLKHLKSLRDLSTLYLYNANITNDGLKYLKPLTSLKTLRLGGNMNITNDGLPHLKELKNLSELTLDHTQVTKGGRDLLIASLPNIQKD